MERSLEIVDAHMHLWSPVTHPWVQSVRDGGHPAGKFGPVCTYLLDSYLQDVEGYNISHSVHVEAGWPGDPVAETHWLDKIAESNAAGTPQAIVGYCDLAAPQAEDTLQRHCQSPRFRGVRQILNHHPTKPIFSEAPHDKYLTDPQWLKGVSLLQKFGLSFELHILPSQMHRAAEVTRLFPEVMFMVNHCGLPYERDSNTMKLWRDGLTQLSQQPNVYCKISGIFATDPQWRQETVADVVQPILDIFGMDRCLFASNFPVDRINGTFSQLMDTLSVILGTHSTEQTQKFLSGNAKSFYHLQT